MADVLLVDDNGSVLLTLAIALRRHGHQVTASSNARQALSHLEQHRFDFLVSDVRMPGMSGVELAARARHLPQPPRIVLTSAYSNVEAREGIAEAYLRKPVDIQQLLALLAEAAPVVGAAHSSTANAPTASTSVANAAAETPRKDPRKSVEQSSSPSPATAPREHAAPAPPKPAAGRRFPTPIIAG